MGLFAGLFCSFHAGSFHILKEILVKHHFEFELSGQRCKSAVSSCAQVRESAALICAALFLLYASLPDKLRLSRAHCPEWKVRPRSFIIRMAQSWIQGQGQGGGFYSVVKYKKIYIIYTAVLLEWSDPGTWLPVLLTARVDLGAKWGGAALKTWPYTKRAFFRRPFSRFVVVFLGFFSGRWIQGADTGGRSTPSAMLFVFQLRFISQRISLRGCLPHMKDQTQGHYLSHCWPQERMQRQARGRSDLTTARAFRFACGHSRGGFSVKRGGRSFSDKAHMDIDTLQECIRGQPGGAQKAWSLQGRFVFACGHWGHSVVFSPRCFLRELSKRWRQRMKGQVPALFDGRGGCRAKQ